MALIAQEDTFVEDHDGIRRLVKAGTPVPEYLGMDIKGERVPTRDLARVEVDEEASRSHADRHGTEQRKPGDGLSMETLDKLRAKDRQSAKRSGGAKADKD